MDVAFISQFTSGRRVFRIVEGTADSFPVKPGDSDALEDTYCQRVVDGRLPQFIPNAVANAEAAKLPVTRLAPVGSHLSVPIVLNDGSVFGTFCCFSFDPVRNIGTSSLRVLQSFADVAAQAIGKHMATVSQREDAFARIKSAIERRQFSTVFQPVYTLADMKMAGCEALTRFSGAPARPPNEWFAEAADTGLGLEMEIATMQAALIKLGAIGQNVYLGLNASPSLLSSVWFEEIACQLPADRVVFEITEHDAVLDYAALSMVSRRLQRLGFKIAVDDAGAGYASLRHILDLEPDIIKIDSSIVRGVDRHAPRQALVAAFVSFSVKTGSDLVAEGIETASEHEALKDLGVKMGQGYHLGRPVDFSALNLPTA